MPGPCGAPSGADAPERGLWAFSLAVYAQGGVAAACLDLQDRRGVDVNLLLFALWAGAACGARLSDGEMERLDGAVAAWRDEVVRPLRAVRRRAKGEPGGQDAYARLKAAELAAERVEQERLEALSGLTPGAGSRCAAAANLRRVVASRERADVAALRVLLDAAAPKRR